MISFMNEDFLLRTATARTRYHETAKKMPIVDYHCHLELKNYFGYEGTLNANTAEEVWNLCNTKLQAPEFSART